MVTIHANDRVAVFGQTGSRETTIVEALIASWRRII